MEVPAKFRSALVGFRYWLLALVLVVTSVSILSCTNTSTTILIGRVGNLLALSVESTTVHPNGDIEVTALVTYKDPDTGNIQVIVGETVQFKITTNLSGSTLSATSAVTNSAGRATIIYTAGSSSGVTDTIDATATLAPEGEDPASDSITINVDPRPVSSIEVDSGASILIANGTSNTAIRATVTDNNNDPSVGATVSFTTTLGSLSGATAVTDNDGIAEVLLTTGTVPGTALVNANAGGFNGQVSVTFIADAPDSITVSALPESVDPNGQTTITATVKDENANPIEGETVNFLIETNESGGSLNALSSITNVNGQASVTYTSGPSTGTDTIRATSASNQAVSGTADVDITAGAIVVGSITVVSGTGTLIADGNSSTIIRATVLDTGGQLASGILVNFSTTAGSLSATSDTTDINGIAEVTLTSATNIGTATITANARGFVATTEVNFIAGGVGNVTLTANPTNILADGTTTSVISALVTDDDGNPVANGEIITFSITAGGGTLSSLTASTTNGVASVTFTSPTTGTSSTIRGEATNGSFGTVTIVFTTEQVASIELQLGNTSLVANGVQSTTAIATVTNTDGNPVSDGTLVTFTIPANGGDIDSTTAGTQLTVVVPTTGGIAVAVLTASTTSGNYVLTATSSGVGQLALYELTPGPANAGNTSLTANPTSIPADGISTSLLTLLAQDVNGNPVTDGTAVNFYTDLGTLSSATGSTAFGVATVILTSGTTDGLATITAVIDGVTVQATVAFGFVAGVGSGTATTIELSVSSTSIRVQGSGGQESAVISATARDETGNLITDCVAGNMRFTIANGPGGGELLDGTGTTVTKATSNGSATVSLTSGTVSGTVTVLVEVILDGTCANPAVYASALTTPIGIEAGEPANITIFQPTEVVQNADGSISMIISALVQDQYSNPVEDDTVIFFGLVDNPPTTQFPERDGYKVAGTGSTTAGSTIFGSVVFVSPSAMDFANVAVNDSLIVLEGRDKGGHIIKDKYDTSAGVAADELELYNQLLATNTGLPFVAGSAELGTVCGVVTTGNLEPDGTCNPATGTPIKGVAHSRLTWTPQGIFKPFYLYAESVGRTVGDAIGDAYPAVAPVAMTVTINPPSVLSGQQDIEVFAQYTDGGGHFIPNEVVTFISSNPLVASFGGPPPGGSASTTDTTNSAGRASTNDLDTIYCLDANTNVTITASSGPFSGSAGLSIGATAPTANFNCVDDNNNSTATCTSTATTPTGTTITTYDWDCNGSASSPAQGPVVTCTFGTNGTFPVTHTVTNNADDGAAGNCDGQLIKDVIIGSNPPVAVQSTPVATSGSGGPPCDYDFDGSGSTTPAGTSITSYDWDIDGTVYSTVAPSHQFTTSGSFSASLAVTNNLGFTSSADIEVVPCPVP
jgi:adhesin/invasin